MGGPIDEGYRDSVLAAIQGSMPTLRREVIPYWVKSALRGDALATRSDGLRDPTELDYSQLVGSFGGREWEVIPRFGHPAFGPGFGRIPVVHFRALLRLAPPGEESRHFLPWLIFGDFDPKVARDPGFEWVLLASLMAARSRRRPLPRDVVSPAGRALMVGAAEPSLVAELRTPEWREAYGVWEWLSGGRKRTPQPFPPIFACSSPFVDLLVGVAADTSAEEFAELARRLSALLDRLEHAAGAPAAAERAIAVAHRVIGGRYTHPVGEPVYSCAECGQLSTTAIAVNPAGIPLTLKTTCCGAFVFAIDPGPRPRQSILKWFLPARARDSQID